MSFLNSEGNRRSSHTTTSEHGINISNTINDDNNDTCAETNDNTPSSHTSNAFSYDASTTPVEPSINTPVPSSQSLPTPYPLPMTSMSQPNITSSVANDPVIQQLQSSLRLMATRIDTIQETTELRFSDMQTQYEKGQHSLQQILKQGLVEINTHCNEERMMMREIRAHQSMEPPTRSVIVPEVRSSTSLLGDPPATNNIIQTPTKHLKVDIFWMHHS
jgi:hypothetical protein